MMSSGLFAVTIVGSTGWRVSVGLLAVTIIRGTVRRASVGICVSSFWIALCMMSSELLAVTIVRGTVWPVSVGICVSSFGRLSVRCPRGCYCSDLSVPKPSSVGNTRVIPL